MGKLNVTILRYLSKEDFRVLTAVSSSENIPKNKTFTVCVLTCVSIFLYCLRYI